ncbi:MAG: hypothetical protein LBD14_02480 [Puniceicoccales bacterium]|jgi:hypothetical protein|nr:hypothetical protein [Puniceicoccales bacterium]
MTTQSQPNTPPHPDDATNQRIDALLSTQSIPCNPRLTDRILNALAHDATLERLLRHQPIAATPQRTEKTLLAIQRIRQRQNILRWLAPTTIAATLLLALTHSIHPPAPPPTEERLAQILTDDPTLAALLDPIPPLTLNPETASIIEGLNDNNLAWLDALTHHEI